MQVASVFMILVEKVKNPNFYKVWVIGIGFESFDDVNTSLGG